MTAETDRPETVVFDTEPLVAYFCDEPGSDTVEEYVETVEGVADGCISAVNLAELHYVVRAIASEERADDDYDGITDVVIARFRTEPG